MRHTAKLLTSLVLAAATSAAWAADAFPTKPLRMIVPFAPGGASDFVGRIIQPAMADLFKQQIVVDNRPGAAGNIGVEAAARASADGYTFLLGNVGTMAVNPNYYTKFAFRPLKHLIPVSQVVDVPGSLVVHPSVPAKSTKELVAYMKANPNKLNYGAAAPSSANTLDALSFLNMTGTQATQVPYKGGAGPATVGLLGNEVQFVFLTFSSTLPFVKQNRLRMLGIIAPQRNPAMPDMPTMKEQGYDMTVGSWQGVFLPAGTPDAVVKQYYEVVQKAMKDAGVNKRLGDSGVPAVTSKSSADFRAFVTAETARFGKIIRDNKIKTE
jgi:tripartite-type tricarboxylate transporter receptor subunit TctC